MDVKYFVRNPVWSCFYRNSQICFVSECSEECIIYDNSTGGIAYELWCKCTCPKLESELTAALIDRGHQADSIIRIIAALHNNGALISGDEAQLNGLIQHIDPQELPCDRLLVCMTGAIQSEGFSPFLHALRRFFCKELKIILTESASKLVQQKALMHRLDSEVFVDIFEDTLERRVPHIYLADWASCILVAPATAATIHRIAEATCDDLISLTITAAKSVCPVIIGPSMNSRMWHNPGVQKNIAKCHERGYWIIEPGLGREVNETWENRTPSEGAFGTQPSNLVKVLEGAYRIQRSQTTAAE